MDDVETIKSFGNPLVKRIRRLQQETRARQKEKAFFAEGVPITSKAFENDAPIETVVYCDPLLTSAEGRVALAQQKARGVPCIALSESVFRKVSQRNNPDGLGVICRTNWVDLENLTPKPSDVFVATEDLSDPGNLGTILRTMDAVRAAALILVRESTQPFHPRTVRASRGTLFTVPVCHSPGMETVFDWARSHDIRTIATSANADQSFWDAAYTLPVLLVFGNENRGLDDQSVEAADHLVTVPMQGTNSSLNLSVAVSLVLYEIRRRACGAD